MKTNEKFQMTNEELKNVLGGIDLGTGIPGCPGAGCDPGCKTGCLNGCSLSGQTSGITPSIQKCVVLGRM